MKLDVDRLIADCYDAVNDHAPTKAVREVLARTVSDPAAVVAALGVAVGLHGGVGDALGVREHRSVGQNCKILIT